jgi:hypothetical protein
MLSQLAAILALALPTVPMLAQTAPSLDALPAIGGTNLLANGQFEDGCSGWFPFDSPGGCVTLAPGASGTGHAIRVNNNPTNNLWAQYVSSTTPDPPVLVLEAYVKNLDGAGKRVSAQGLWGTTYWNDNTGTGGLLFLLAVLDDGVTVWFDGAAVPLVPVPKDGQFHRLDVVMVTGADTNNGAKVPNMAVLLVDGLPATTTVQGVPGVPAVLTGQHSGLTAPRFVFFGDGGYDTTWGSTPDLAWDELYIGPQMPAPLPALPSIPRVVP